MDEREIIKLIEYTLEKKLEQNENIISYSFYELRVKYNLTEEETQAFLYLIKNKLNYMGYKIYFTGDNYNINNKEKVVQSNELIVALKL